VVGKGLKEIGILHQKDILELMWHWRPTMERLLLQIKIAMPTILLQHGHDYEQASDTSPRECCVLDHRNTMSVHLTSYILQ